MSGRGYATGMTLGKTLGAIGVAIGMGVAAVYFLDLHAHVCSGCGRRWRHLGAFSFGDAYAHECPEPGCKTVQWWREGHEAARSKLFVDDILGGVQRSARGMFTEGVPPIAIAQAPIPLEPLANLVNPLAMKGG